MHHSVITILIGFYYVLVTHLFNNLLIAFIIHIVVKEQPESEFANLPLITLSQNELCFTRFIHI